MPISLKTHNIETYQKVTEKLNESNRVAVIHPTGTGKSFIAMKLIEDNPDKKAIYLAPSLGILLQLKTPNGQAIKMTYQTLAKLDDEEIKKLGVDIIVLDEFHHCGAPVWGEAVEKLTNSFPNAKVLGLSATPIRYFDGNKDMAEKLFGSNIASEMSFEEAVEKGILPEFDYVSALYGAEESLKILKNRIDDTDSIAASKKEEAYRLYNELKTKIDNNAQNLPQVFKKHIKKSNGKYIIFCRNIDDLKTRIEEVRRLFGDVNDNLDIYNVSSYDTKQKNSRNIKEFTENKNPNTLKLMFAVNMLNEGFHLPDIDGVIMLRPTMSPTIYQQQMGRALSCSNEGKRPVIIDLVDNFNSIQIIEDFNERMNRLESKGTGRQESESQRQSDRKIKLYDYLKDTNEIIDRIQKLSRRNSLTIDEKLDLFEQYLNHENTGETIISDTIYEGYPIGTFLISIRHELNDERKAKKYSKEIVEKLENLGLLDDRNESTIDEKIDRLIRFVQENTELWELNKGRKTEIAVKKFLGENPDKEKKKELIKQLELANKDYDYIRNRKSKGKLSEENIKRLKYAGVGGVFGKSSKSELQKQEFLDKYEIEPDIYDLIIKKYGSMEKFKKIYVEALIRDNIKETIDKKVLNNCNLVKTFDISSPDWVARNTGLTELIRDITLSDGLFGNYNGLEEKFIKLIREGGFTKQQEQVLFMYYGVNGYKRENQAQIARRFNKSRSSVSQMLEKSLKKIRTPISFEKPNVILDIDYDLHKEIIEEYFKFFGIFISKEPTSVDEEIKNKLTKMLSDAIERIKKRQEQVKIIKKMPKEEQIEILKARFGDKINTADLRIIAPYERIYQKIDEKNGVNVDEKMINSGDLPSLFKECLDSDLCQSKIAEYMITNSTNSGLAVDEKKEELEDIISGNKYISKKKKSELKELLDERTREAVKEKIIEELSDYIPIKPVRPEVPIEELDLSVRAYNCLRTAGYNTLEHFIGKPVEYLKNVKGLGKNCYDEIIEKIKPFEIEIEEGHFEYKGKGKIIKYSMDPNIRKQLEEEINSTEVFNEDEKESLRQMVHDTYQKRIDIEEEKLHSEILANSVLNMKICKLGSYCTYWYLDNAGYHTVGDLIGKSGEDLMMVDGFGKRTYHEIIEKLKPLGIKMVDGYFVDTSKPDINKMMELEEKINSNEYISEEKKEELRVVLYETFKVKNNDNQKNQSTSKENEEMSKEEIIKHILEQQKTISRQREEIDQLSSKNMEVKDE